MRVTKSRYHNQVQRYALAARMVAHEVRTDTICRWSGLSEGRVRELYRAFARERGDRRTVRHRGPAPKQPAFFLRTAQVCREAGALAVVCATLGVLPEQPLPNAPHELPGLQRGELLCRAYEMFKGLVGASTITLEHTLLLAIAIAQGTQLTLGHCQCCGGAVIFHPHGSARSPACKQCQADAEAL